MMISSPNSVGRRTSTAASRTTARGAGRPASPWARWRTMFSTSTTELSTTLPKSMAPRPKRLAAVADLLPDLASGHVADFAGRASLRGQHDAAEVGEAGDPALAVDQHRLAVLADGAAADVEVAVVADFLDHVLEGQAVLEQPVRV